LTATVAPTNATNKAVTWTTSNSAIATVSTSGLVTGKAAGSATITVKTSDQSKTATSVITVAGTTVTYYRIKNRWQGTYLYDAGDRVRYAAAPSSTDLLYQWTQEDIGGGLFEIKNASTGEYMHIENLLGYVQCTARTVGWYSSRWAFESTGDGYYRIRNAWQSTSYMHIENLQSQLQYGTINTAWLSAQWQLETVVKSAKELYEASPMREISCMPNPVQDYLTIHFSGNLYTNLTVLDLSGRVCMIKNLESDQNEVTIDLTQLRPGIYIIRFNNVNSTQAIKILKN
jgi:hypothetical protein